MDDENELRPQTCMKCRKIFLFKSPKENEVDKFAELLEEAGISCASIPVLSFQFINQDILKSHLTSINLFSAIIFTSVRAVEAVSNLLGDLNKAEDITQMPTYVVGRTTGEAAKKYGFSPKGEETGNAQMLADYILQEVGEDKCKPMLYPCSNIHRDTLKETLKRHGVQVTDVISYETCPNKRLKETTQESVETLGLPDYAVFFSPSGFQYTSEAIDAHLLPLKNVKLIAMGPATQKSICEHGYTPFAVAEKPEPKSLLQLLV